jgi:hypothetical protein
LLYVSDISEASSTGAWVCYQIIVSGCVGIIFTATKPSTLAPLPASDIAAATGTYSFIRTFALLWGVTIVSIAFNNQFVRFSLVSNFLEMAVARHSQSSLTPFIINCHDSLIELAIWLFSVTNGNNFDIRSFISKTL